jgi:hypothetical protein
VVLPQVPGQRLVGWADVAAAAEAALRAAWPGGPPLPPGWEGLVELLICAQAGAWG